jgi:hypothetical protein
MARRKKFLRCVVTGQKRRAYPEEHVRQWFASWLMTHAGYLASDMRLGFYIKVFSKRPQADIVIFRRSFRGHERYARPNIFMIVECKEYDVSDSRFLEAEEQLEGYLAAVLRAEYGIVTDGTRIKVIRKGYDIHESGLDDWKVVPHDSVPSVDCLHMPPVFSLAQGLATAQLLPKPQPLPLPTHTIERHAAMSADIAHWPQHETEILMRNGLTPEAKRLFDVEYLKQVTSDAEARTTWNKHYWARDALHRSRDMQLIQPTLL